MIRLWAFHGLWLLLFGVSPAQAADSPGLPAETTAAYEAAQTFSGDLGLRLKYRGQEIRLRGTFRLQKPNRVRVDLVGTFARTIVSDGETEWVLIPEARRCLKSPVSRFYARNFNLLWAKPLSLFFSPDWLVLGQPAAPRSVRSLAPETIGRVRYQVLEVKADGEGAQTIRYYLGADRLVHRMRAEIGAGDDRVILEATLRNLRLGSPLPAETFTFRPPSGVHVYDPDRVGDLDRLVVEGDPAPDWTLPLAGGGRLSLKEALRGKKSLLLNFWFYR